jgi:hypothetical protein
MTYRKAHTRTVNGRTVHVRASGSGGPQMETTPWSTMRKFMVIGTVVAGIPVLLGAGGAMGAVLTVSSVLCMVSIVASYFAEAHAERPSGEDGHE